MLGRYLILFSLTIPLILSTGIEYSILIKNGTKYLLVPVMDINTSYILNISERPINVSLGDVISKVDNRSMVNLYRCAAQMNNSLVINYTGLGYLVFEKNSSIIDWKVLEGKRLYYIDSGVIKEYNITEVPFKIQENRIKEKIIFGIGLAILVLLLL